MINFSPLKIENFSHFFFLKNIFMYNNKSPILYSSYKKNEKTAKFARAVLDDYEENELTRKFLIQIVNPDGYRKYVVFENYLQYVEFYIKFPGRTRDFYETILGAQKPHFDIDIDKKKYPNLKGENILKALIEAIVQVMLGKEINLILRRDIVIFTSHGPEKESYHIIIDNYCHLNYYQAKKFYDVVIETILINQNVLKEFNPAKYEQEKFDFGEGVEILIPEGEGIFKDEEGEIFKEEEGEIFKEEEGENIKKEENFSNDSSETTSLESSDENLKEKKEELKEKIENNKQFSQLTNSFSAFNLSHLTFSPDQLINFSSQLKHSASALNLSQDNLNNEKTVLNPNQLFISRSDNASPALSISGDEIALASRNDIISAPLNDEDDDPDEEFINALNENKDENNDNIAHAKYLSSPLSLALLPELQIIIDHSVYKSFQQFRLPNCAKTGTGRMKKILLSWTYQNQTINYQYRAEKIYNEEYRYQLELEAGCVSYVGNCQYLPPFGPTEEDDEDKRYQKGTYENTFHLNRDDIKIILNQLLIYEMTYNNLKRLPYALSKVDGGLIELKRIAPSFCQICKRVHDKQNPFLYLVGKKRNLYWHCRRASPEERLWIAQLEESVGEYFDPREEEEIEEERDIIAELLNNNDFELLNFDLNSEEYVNIVNEMVLENNKMVKYVEEMRAKREKEIALERERKIKEGNFMENEKKEKIYTAYDYNNNYHKGPEKKPHRVNQPLTEGAVLSKFEEGIFKPGDIKTEEIKYHGVNQGSYIQSVNNAGGFKNNGSESSVFNNYQSDLVSNGQVSESFQTSSKINQSFNRYNHHVANAVNKPNFTHQKQPEFINVGNSYLDQEFIRKQKTAKFKEEVEKKESVKIVKIKKPFKTKVEKERERAKNGYI